MKKLLYSVLSVIFLLPLLLTIIKSFTGENDLFSLGRYDDLLIGNQTFYRAFWNTTICTLVISLSVLIITIPAAFAVTRIKSRLIDVFFVILVIMMLMPLQVTLLPNYIGLRDIGLLDTRLAIIVPAVFSPVYAVILIQYMRGIDTSIIEAVQLESNSIVRVIITAVIPQIKPCIYAVFILSSAESWNMVEQPINFIHNENYMPLSIFMNQAMEWDILYPAAVISLIPMILLYWCFGDELKDGITLGGLHE